MTHPRRVVLCVGTATEIGKTWVGHATLQGVRAAHPELTVIARKPVQSFDPDDPHPTDAALLAEATGEDEEVVCPPHRSYARAEAPPMAASNLGQPSFTVADLVGELGWPDEPADLAWVETVGGPRSPMADDGDGVTFATLLDPDHVVVVADAGLGTINATLLARAPLSHWPATVLLNRFDPGVDLHLRNLGWLQEREGLDVVTDPEDLAARLTAPL